MKTLISIISVIVVLMAGTIGWQYSELSQKQPVGSVNTANEYRAVYATQGGTQTAVLSTGPATLGSIVITGANTGTLKIYNATTTDVTKRALATSSLAILAAIPASLAAGTYTFDVSAVNGLMYDWTGTIATSTITWR